jgi:hypothetical protein
VRVELLDADTGEVWQVPLIRALARLPGPGRRHRHSACTGRTRLASACTSNPDSLDDIVRSHDIDPVALRSDDFEAFFTARFERLLQQIQDGHR